MDPNLEPLRRLGRGSAFEAAPGHVLLVGRLDHLAIRCHAEVCVHQGGEPQLGGVVPRGARSRPEGGVVPLQPRSREDGGEAPMPEGTFDEIDAQEPGRFATGRMRARSCSTPCTAG